MFINIICFETIISCLQWFIHQHNDGQANDSFFYDTDKMPITSFYVGGEGYLDYTVGPLDKCTWNIYTQRHAEITNWHDYMSDGALSI